ncbi:ABC transporter permease [Acidimangrovimonas pyrenivorans]|uniref:ABC transporter permease n=1 Tax=Acidimangrovimonas pyrenivorans TaxID=2030798 RepID=A0ABV7ALU1_9RHOB
MHALDLKLLRDVRRLWAQSLAIALVLGCGVMTLVLFHGVARSLTETRNAYYERNRFADVFATATRAPDSLLEQINHIPGVARSEARVSEYAVLDIAGLEEPAMGHLLSLPRGGGAPVLNVPVLTSGRWPAPDKPGEVVVNAPFAKANGFTAGSTFEATINGRKRVLTVTGTVLSPEFIYTMPPGGMMPDDRRFGIIWMSRDVLEAAYGLNDAFNDVTLGLTVTARPERVKARLDQLLAPYGGTGATGRDLQISWMFLDSELTQLDSMVRILPPIFFVVAAFLVNMVLSRLIRLERAQIGLLKALGYGGYEVAWHYVKLALAIGVLGVLLGWGFGLWAAHGLASLYAQFYHFPFLVFVQHPDTYVISAAGGLATAAFGAVTAVRGVLRLSPAVAMAPPVPPHFRHSPIDRLMAWAGVRQTAMMVVRSLARWPLRAALTSLGIGLSCSVLVASLFSFDSIDRMIESAFYLSNRQSATITFAQDRPQSAVDDVARLPGVMRAEGVLSLPVRLSHGARNRLISIEGHAPGDDLARVVDSQSDRVVLPSHGLVLTDRLARHLNLQLGDKVDVEVMTGRRGHYALPVTGIITQHFGLGAYMDYAALNRMLEQAPQVSAVNVMLDEDKLPALFKAVKETPGIAAISLLAQIRQSFRDTVAESIGVQTFIYTLMGALIVIGVVYNAARIQLSERARELASLRILGFSRAEVSAVLLGELGILTLVAIPLGLYGGYLFALLITSSFSSDLFTMPLVIARATYLKATATVAVSALVSALIVRRRIDRLDLVAVMKTRE